jgi:hypothetical protein
MLPEPPDVFPWWGTEGEEKPALVQARAVQHQRVTPARTKRHRPRHERQHQGWAPVPVHRSYPTRLNDRTIAILAVALFLLLAGAVMGVVGIVCLALITA